MLAASAARGGRDRRVRVVRVLVPFVCAFDPQIPVQLLGGAELPAFDGVVRYATNWSSSFPAICGNAGMGGAPC